MNDIRVSLDFARGRGFGSMGAGLPTNYLSGDRVTVLSTIAAIYLHPNPARANSSSQAVAMLALYGAGAQVRLSAKQYLGLDRVAANYESVMSAPIHGNKGNENLANAVRRYAGQRFGHDTGADTTGLVDVDFRGWGNEGLIGSPEDLSFFDHLPGLDPARIAEAVPMVAPAVARQRRQRDGGDHRGELLTVAFLCIKPSKKRADPLAQAVSLLALYAAGAEIHLTAEQYQELDGKAAEFDYTGTDMSQVAGFVREHAATRMRAELAAVN